MNTFDKAFAEKKINSLLKKHRITVYAWSVTSCGRAYPKTRRIKIPRPTNIDRFAVCLHEIFHVIGRKGSKSFEKEFYCDMYARNTLIELGYDITDWDRRTRWHVLSRIAMAHNRGLQHDKIKPEIRNFFPDIDFSKWIGQKVFVGYSFWKSSDPKDIQFTASISKDRIEALLKHLGYSLHKSDRDDSTYGNWIVAELGNDYGSDYENLSEVVRMYKLDSVELNEKML